VHVQSDKSVGSKRSITTTRLGKGPNNVKQGLVSGKSSVTNRTAAIQKSVLRNRSMTGATKGANKQFARANFRGQFIAVMSSSSAGSARCSGPTPMTTSSTTPSGPTPTIRSGRTPMTMSM
jgi:hypothetical protein